MRKVLRLIGVGTLTAAALTAGVAQAEPGQFAGAFSFQTDNLKVGPEVQILSGYAVADLQDQGTYRVRLLATELSQNAEGVSRRLYAPQLCTGQLNGAEMVITCQLMHAPTPDYRPDNFRLRQVPDVPGVWRGTLISAGSAPVEFFDLD